MDRRTAAIAAAWGGAWDTLGLHKAHAEIHHGWVPGRGHGKARKASAEGVFWYDASNGVRVLCHKRGEGMDEQFRPVSLVGIENNNGWTILADKPLNANQKGWYHILRNDGLRAVCFFNGKFFETVNARRENRVTHYQPTTFPDGPVY